MSSLILTLSSLFVYPESYNISSCMSHKYFKFDMAKKEISVVLPSPICSFPNLYHISLFKPKTCKSLLILYFLSDPPQLLHSINLTLPSFKTYFTSVHFSFNITLAHTISHAWTSLRASSYFSCPLII